MTLGGYNILVTRQVAVRELSVGRSNAKVLLEIEFLIHRKGSGSLFKVINIQHICFVRGGLHKCLN